MHHETQPRLYLGDCIDVMKTIPDGSVDLILADLPYGTTACKWDAVIPFEPLWAAYRRVLKPRGAVVLTASQPFTSRLVMSNPKWFRYEWIWRKNIATGFLDANRKPLKSHESILVFSERAAPYWPQGVERRRQRRRNEGTKGTDVYGSFKNEWISEGSGFPKSVIDFPCDRGKGHPSAKPVALGSYLIRTYSNPGDVVLDNTMGSGTFGVSAIQEDRSFISVGGVRPMSASGRL